MARTKRAQVLMEPEEYDRLEEIAKQQGVSVAELIREAVSERFFNTPQRRQQIVEEIFSMGLPTEDWSATELEIGKAHDGCLP